MAATYGTLACVLTWPLPLYLRTRLLGDPAGDLGVYVWNVWIFRHELVRHAHLPFSTDHLFGLTGAADFTFHNFTPVAGALAAPLIGPLGVVTAFNVVMLALMGATGIGTFALARHLGLGRGASWWAGALFMAAPAITARETAHFSLVIAAPLPLFLWALLRTLDRRRARDAALVGAITALATYSDAYYGIYCVLMGAAVLSWRFLRVYRPEPPAPWQLTRAASVVVAVLALIVAGRLLAGPAAIAVGSVNVSVRSLYTPLLLLTLAAGFRLWLRRRPRLRLDDPDRQLPACFRLGLIAVGTCALLLLPPLIGVGLRQAAGRLPDTTVYWRSSPRGLDLLAYVVPNPTHAWFGDSTREWFLPPYPDAFPEYVGAFSLGALALVAVGLWHGLLPRFWVIFTAAFIWLSLGPFVHVAGVNTNIVGPWALLRYLPVIGMARSPARFAIVAALGVSLLAAFAMSRLRERGGRWRSAAVAAIVAAVLVVELVPAPRPLYSAAVPDVYQLVAARTTHDEVGRLLELPTGVRDGTSSAGNFSALSSYFQTSHRRPIVGGYLSRVSSWRKAEKWRMPMFGALMTLSEGASLSPAEEARARDARDAFLARSCTRFVLVDRHRASDALHDFAVSSLRLTLVKKDADYALYTPADPPPCRAPLPASRLTDVSWLWQPAE